MHIITPDEQHTAVWDEHLISRYDLSGPRYTSYPTAPQFHESFGNDALHAAISRSNRRGNPLSLYFHIPFCSRVCYYCACNKIITANRRVAAPYLERMEKEIAMMAALVDTSRPVKQLHWGGGTPTYINDNEKRALMSAIRHHFNLLENDEGEYALEIHPGDTSVESIACLRELGFNRLSMGIQDFEPDVQQAVNRFNTEQEVRALVEAGRKLGFYSISMDLIYGLPLQNRETFARTLDSVIALSPDRLSIFNYAHMPHLFKTQQQMDAQQLPAPEEKLVMLHEAIEKMLQAGYVYIGMDHFAKPEDELAIAQREGKLQRNFQGYATHGDCDLFSFGVSAISGIGDTFSQNHKDIAQYNAAIDNDELPVARGLALTENDKVRAAVIEALICHFQLRFATIESRFAIDFAQVFSAELDALLPMEKDGLVELDSDGIQVTAPGRMLIRRICMVFDDWLRKPEKLQTFSRII